MNINHDHNSSTKQKMSPSIPGTQVLSSCHYQIQKAFDPEVAVVSDVGPVLAAVDMIPKVC